MKNRLITVAFMAFVMGSTIQLVSAQAFGATIPCKVTENCQNDRLPENAKCESGVCVCPDVHSKPHDCTLADIRVQSAKTSPAISTAAHKSSSKGSPPEISTKSIVVPDPKTLNLPTVSNTTETTPEPTTSSTVVTDPMTANPSTVSNTTETTPEPTNHPASRTATTDSEGCPTACPTPFGICNATRKQCDCTEGYVMAVNNTQCLAVALELGSNCTENEQCQKNMEHTTCEDEQCICEKGYHEDGYNQCWKSIKLGENCNSTKDCSHAFGATCDRATSLCKCLSGNTPNEDRDTCLSIANNYLDACQEKSQCLAKIPNSICLKGECRCKKEYHFNETESACFSYPSLGQTCGKDYECDQDEEPGVTRFQLCEDKICTCQAPFYQAGDICTDGAASLVPGFLSILAAIFLFSRG